MTIRGLGAMNKICNFWDITQPILRRSATIGTKKFINYASHLPSHLRSKTSKVKEALWLQADGNLRAFFKFAGIDRVNTDGNVGDDESERRSGSNRKRRGWSSHNKEKGLPHLQSLRMWIWTMPCVSLKTLVTNAVMKVG